MLLKSLEIHGFKSFPDKTVLTFGKGITAVVGPNGSGKSNVSDAIRWVLGEQSAKSLRGSKMEEVIFSGTTGAAKRHASGFAEVSLIIDNADRKLEFDADDVKVTRRYFRSGESEYLLNNNTVRLRDVQMLFMDTGLGRDGYSIVGQGRIGDIVSSKSDDRREIFEEAAGIAKYRFRKNEAERRLHVTEDNLLRLRDILRELEERVGPLKIQSEKAQKFLEYAGEKKELEIGVWLHTIKSTRDTMRNLNAKLELARTHYDDAGSRMEDMDAEREDIELAAQKLAADMDAVRRAAQEREDQAVACDHQISLLRNDITHHTEDEQRIRKEMADSLAGGSLIDADIAHRQQTVEEKRKQIAASDTQREALSEQLDALIRNNESMSGQMEALTTQTSGLADRLSDIRVRAVTAQSSLSEITLRLSQLTAAVALRTQEHDRLQGEIVACRDDRKHLDEQIESLQNTLKGYEFRYQSRQGKAQTARSRADELALEAEEKRRRVRLLEEMERNMEGFSQSVRTVIKQAERGVLSGIRGPVSRLLHTENTYALAIETALGGAAQNIVCDTEEDAKRGIRYLKENKGGRATFLPVSTVNGNVLHEAGLEGQPGFIGIASELVQCDAAYSGIARQLLGRTAVAEDLNDATALAKRFGYRFRIVTVDGQVVNAGGSMTGGSSVKGAGLLSRRSEIERLGTEYQTLLKQTEEAKAAFAALQQEVAAAQAEMVGTQGELSTAQEDKIRLEGEWRRLTEQEQAGKQAMTECTTEIETLNQRAAECRATADRAAEETARLTAEKQALEEQLNTLSGGRQELQEQREALSSAIGEHKLSVLALNKEIEAETAAVAELSARKADQVGYRASLAQQIEDLHVRQTALEAAIKEQAEQAAALRASAGSSTGQIEALMQQRAAGETRQTELRRLNKETLDEREKAGQEVARIEEKCASAQQAADDVVRRLYEEYELTRTEAEAMAQPIEDISVANRRLAELKNKIRALGNVNVSAVEEYKEVSTRYAFMNEQVQDVETSKAELLKLIGELTAQMKEIFLERFRQINQQFALVFAELFAGGKAELILADPDDILNSGIDMKVLPPGKMVVNLDSLSGGEKSLVATALLFAILKVTPSPFCVLDEIEAALDDVNVVRYAQYLRRMCDRSQFIVITHRRGTMEEADVLYGITMQEQGVSKMLELRASEVEAKLGISGNKLE